MLGDSLSTSSLNSHLQQQWLLCSPVDSRDFPQPLPPHALRQLPLSDSSSPPPLQLPPVCERHQHGLEEEEGGADEERNAAAPSALANGNGDGDAVILAQWG